MKKSFRSLSLYAAALPLLAACPASFSSTAQAQSTAVAEVAPDTFPDSPGTLATADQASSSGQSAATLPAASQSSREKPPKRLFGIVPNFRSVSTDETLPRQTPRDKFTSASEDSFDYSSLALVSLVSLEGYVANSDPEFGRGGLGYARYLWHSAADQTIENYLVEFIVPSLFHEDTRFYTLTRGSTGHRAAYSLSRVILTKSDNGKRTVNAGELLGAAASSGISNLYYPRQERTFQNFATRYATNLGIDAASYFVKEFYPEISGVFSHHKHDGPTP